MKSKKIEVNCSFTSMVLIGDLKPHPKNPNTHSPKQIKLLAKVIQHRGWRSPIVVSRKSGFIVAGHGRLAAAEHLGLMEVPVDYQTFESEADEVAHLIGDNKLAELGEIDIDALNRVIEDDIRMAGIDTELAGILDEHAEGEVREVKLPPTPKMTWVLIGIPTPRFGEINEQVERIARVEGTVCEVAAGSK